MREEISSSSTRVRCRAAFSRWRFRSTPLDASRYRTFRASRTATTDRPMAIPAETPRPVNRVIIFRGASPRRTPLRRPAFAKLRRGLAVVGSADRGGRSRGPQDPRADPPARFAALARTLSFDESMKSGFFETALGQRAEGRERVLLVAAFGADVENRAARGGEQQQA